ncbi:MAG: hypothetical protein GOU97_01125 [Nanoarchaeota archaeon]|nr:hypothetical protein [Nanoarchaeota archaeon]
MKRLNPDEAELVTRVARHVEDGNKQRSDLTKVSDEELKQYEELKPIALSNYQELLKNPVRDVYLSVSMRSEKDYKIAHVLENALTDKDLTVHNPAMGLPLLRWELSDLDSLMVNNCKSLYWLCTKETYGTSSEVAQALQLEKCVVTHVVDTGLENDDYRREVLHDLHPRSVINGTGMHVTSSLEQGLDCLTSHLQDKLVAREEKVAGKTNLICSNCDSVIKRS